jgi:hypothetical protein
MIPEFPNTPSPRRPPRRKIDRAHNQVADAPPAVCRELDVNPVSMAIETVTTIPVDVTPVPVAAITSQMQEIRLEDPPYELILSPVVSHPAEVSSVMPHSAEVVEAPMEIDAPPPATASWIVTYAQWFVYAVYTILGAVTYFQWFVCAVVGLLAVCVLPLFHLIWWICGHLSAFANDNIIFIRATHAFASVVGNTSLRSILAVLIVLANYRRLFQIPGPVIVWIMRNPCKVVMFCIWVATLCAAWFGGMHCKNDAVIDTEFASRFIQVTTTTHEMLKKAKVTVGDTEMGVSIASILTMAHTFVKGVQANHRYDTLMQSRDLGDSRFCTEVNSTVERCLENFDDLQRVFPTKPFPEKVELLCYNNTERSRYCGTSRPNANKVFERSGELLEKSIELYIEIKGNAYTQSGMTDVVAVNTSNHAVATSDSFKNTSIHVYQRLVYLESLDTQSFKDHQNDKRTRAEIERLRQMNDWTTYTTNGLIAFTGVVSKDPELADYVVKVMVWMRIEAINFEKESRLLMSKMSSNQSIKTVPAINVDIFLLKGVERVKYLPELSHNDQKLIGMGRTNLERSKLERLNLERAKLTQIVTVKEIVTVTINCDCNETYNNTYNETVAVFNPYNETVAVINQVSVANASVTHDAAPQTVYMVTPRRADNEEVVKVSDIQVAENLISVNANTIPYDETSRYEVQRRGAEAHFWGQVFGFVASMFCFVCIVYGFAMRYTRMQPQHVRRGRRHVLDTRAPPDLLLASSHLTVSPVLRAPIPQRPRNVEHDLTVKMSKISCK